MKVMIFPSVDVIDNKCYTLLKMKQRNVTLHSFMKQEM